MSGGFDMAAAVRPLFAVVDGGYEFAGTGFFVHHPSRELLVTARHVTMGKQILMCRNADGNGVLKDLLEPTKLIASSGADLAILELENFRSDHKLMLMSNSPSSVEKIVFLEYSRLGVSHGYFYENASCRVGNIVRAVNDDRYPSNTLELSYPALQGASGAPVVVFREGGFGPSHMAGVAGVIVANVQSQLAPVQTYFYKDVGGAGEETIHYYLPAGLAVNVDHLKKLLATITD